MLVDGYFGKATQLLNKSADHLTRLLAENIRRKSEVVKQIGDWQDKLTAF